MHAFDRRQERLRAQKVQSAQFWKTTRFMATRRSAMILFSDILLRDEDNHGLDPDPYLTAAIASLLVNVPAYPYTLKLYLGDNYNQEFSWKKVFRHPREIMTTKTIDLSHLAPASNGNSAAAGFKINPAAARTGIKLPSMVNPELSAFSSHCAVTAFFWGNYIGRYYTLQAHLDESFDQQDKASQKKLKKMRTETILDKDGNVISSSSGGQESSASSGGGGELALWKKLGLSLVAAELSRLWATLLSAPIEVVRTHLNEDMYSKVREAPKQQSVSHATAAAAAKEGAEKAAAESVAAAAEAEAFDPSKRRYKGYGDCASKLLKEGGMKKMWSRARMMFYRPAGVVTSICLVAFERSRNYYHPRQQNISKKKIDWKEIGLQ